MASARVFSRGPLSLARVPTPPWPPLIKGGKGHGEREGFFPGTVVVGVPPPGACKVNGLKKALLFEMTADNCR